MPYKISSPTFSLASYVLSPNILSQAAKIRAQVITNRIRLINALNDLALRKAGIGQVRGGSQANFVVVPVYNAGERYEFEDDRARKVVKDLRERHGIAVRYIRKQAHCAERIKITVGTARENQSFVNTLIEILQDG